MQTMSTEIQCWDTWNTAHRAGDEPYLYGLGELVAKQVRRLGHPTVLEMGCGTGWFASLVNAPSYMGLDLSPDAIGVARRRNISGARFGVADLTTFQPWRTYDCVVLIDTIAYVRDQDAVIARAAQSLAKRGSLILTTVNPFIYSRLKRVGPPLPGQVRHWLTRSEIHNLLDRHGLYVRRYRTALPDGDHGWLRYVNNRRLRPLDPLRNALCLGQYQIVEATRWNELPRWAHWLY